MKPKLIAIGLLIMNITYQLSGQVTKVKYQLKYDEYDSTFYVYLNVYKGHAIEAKDRIQFNAQISLVIPTGSSFVLQDMYMPLRSNQLFNGSESMQWQISSATHAPICMPKNDFYSITPILSPTAFYNQLEEGSEVKLFSFKVISVSSSWTDVRLYENNTDPNWKSNGMDNADYTNSFTLGSVANDYIGNLPLSVIHTTGEKNFVNDKIRLYPNPILDQLTIETNQPIHFYDIMDMNGKTLIKGQSKIVDFSSLPMGVYHIELSFGKSKVARQMIKI